MKIIKNCLKIVFAFILFQNNAFAYIDPGTGMLLWQGLIAIFGAILIFVRNPIKAIKKWISRIRRK